MNSLGERIRDLRGKKGINQKDMVETVYGGKDIASKIERGEINPGIDNLIALSQFFEVSIDYLLTGKLNGFAENQSQVGLNSTVKTALGKSMIQNMNELIWGVHSFDRLASNYENLLALEDTASRISIKSQDKQFRQALNEVKNQTNNDCGRAID